MTQQRQLRLKNPRLTNGREIGRAGALVISAMLLLTGCGPKADEAEQTQSPEATVEESATPEPEPEPEPTESEPVTEPESARIVLPECEAMNQTASQEHAEFIANGGTAQISEIDLNSFNETAGPVARNAMKSSTQVRGCSWPVSYHNGVNQYVAELSQEAQQPLLAGLRDSAFSESTLSDAVVFRYTQSVENMVSTADQHITYLFIDDIWITIIDNGAFDYSQAALDGVRAVNP